MSRIDRYTIQRCVLRDTTAPEGVMFILDIDDGAIIPQAVAFLCPCGCGIEIYLPVDGSNVETKWSLSLNDGTPTITPSVAMRGGCMSHYFITRGEVRWC